MRDLAARAVEISPIDEERAIRVTGINYRVQHENAPFVPALCLHFPSKPIGALSPLLSARKQLRCPLLCIDAGIDLSASRPSMGTIHDDGLHQILFDGTRHTEMTTRPFICHRPSTKAP